jgi:hypothetical protein
VAGSVEVRGLALEWAMQSIGKLILMFLLLGALGASTSAVAQHENQSYLPIDKTDLNRRFKLRSLGQIKLDEIRTRKVNIGASGAEIKTEPRRYVRITGKDKAGKTWSVQLGAYCLDIQSYEGDLDRNGLQDLVLLIPTCGNGLAPSSHIITLMFDSRGRPIPFEADGYFECTEHGIADIVDMDRDRRAELVYMNFDDGYWITNLYRATNARWERVTGQFVKYSFPRFVRFTLKENHRSTRPKPGRHPFAPDLSNARFNLNGRIQSYQWANVSQSENFLMVIRDARGKRIECRPESWYASFSVLVDKKDGRRITFLSASEDRVKSLLAEITADQLEVALYGRRQAGRCSPEMISARAH